ncbi:MAG: FtsQ-type POTRA domain-containing protein [Blastochloris sp.]|nr:FtsQ-type POTRA domain-containing protein [Blastochloris sp.]
MQRTVLHVAVNQKVQTKKRNKQVWWAVLALVLMAVIGVGVHVASNSIIRNAIYRNDDFKLKTIEVDVQGGVTKADIIRWSGVRIGQNLMTLNLADIRLRLSNMPYIASVRVERDLPDTLRLIVVERQPVAKIIPSSPNGNRLAQPIYYIDAQGYIMKPKAGEKLKPLPAITGISYEFVQEGVRTERYEIISALNLLRFADESALKGELDLSRIEVESKGYLLLKTRSNGFIRFRTNLLVQQMQRLQVIFEDARPKGLLIRTVDLTPERHVPVTYF